MRVINKQSEERTGNSLPISEVQNTQQQSNSPLGHLLIYGGADMTIGLGSASLITVGSARAEMSVSCQSVCVLSLAGNTWRM